VSTFERVEPRVRFPELEARILAFWREADVFRRSLELRAGAPEWVFYEGPPTANGKPGIHHVEPRTFKDVYPRFKTMTGHLVRRKAGWDCHGLPVELEIEKEIGTSGKRDIEAFGIAAFNARCRESVQRYVGDFERLTERIGFWIDLSEAYWTMSTDYIESVWWSLKRLHQRGLLVEADKVTAYCPRCGTALSDAEVALGYRVVEDPSVYVRFPIVESPDPSLVGGSLLVWTTTPWTLPANTGVAVAPDEPYVQVRRAHEALVLARSRLQQTLGEGWTIERTLPGSAIVGTRYEPPYANVEGAHRVVAADFVSMEEGTGLVHLAPAFGALDLEVGRREGWPVVKPVGDDGAFTEEGPPFVRGLFVKDADPKIVDDLRKRGRLVRAEAYEHSYPFCWRCATPLLYYARTSWYVLTTRIKDRLLEVNEEVNWYPEHIKHGRYGNWLENNVDWALSRDRYWGTPLPIWRCPAGHDTAVGSLRELGELAGRDLGDLDPHRPAIDEVRIRCPFEGCGAEASRLPPVIDAWYDSGAMPFAQWGYHPELGRGIEEFERSFPADFISEAIDQTRGWFYTLMAEGVLHFDSTAYRNVVCLGHIVDRDGRKMSKSLGNVIDPFDVLDRQGADALRWFLLTSGSPWSSRRVSLEVFDEIVRRFLLTLWNVYAFFVTYAIADGFDPEATPPPPLEERPVLDRWIWSELQLTVAEARERLEAYDATAAGRRIERFVDDLSNWYVRRSRRRFWNPGGEPSPDALAAFHTLHGCLVTVAALLAPFTPFIAEELWRNLAAGRSGHPDSVHLADYPEPDPAAIDPALGTAMAEVRRIVELGRRVRVETRIRTRQPLRAAVVDRPAGSAGLAALVDLIAEELNVKAVRFADRASIGRWRAKPNYRALGPRLGARVQALARALADDDGSIAGRLAAGETVAVTVGDGAVELAPSDVELTREVGVGWGVASEDDLAVALDLEIDETLEREGRARELIRVVQDVRRSAGLEVGDRIVLALEGGPGVRDAVEAHRSAIAGETLARELVVGNLDDALVRQEARIDGERVVVALRRA
jgi:isoleucyl-tRNA synthetase